MPKRKPSKEDQIKQAVIERIGQVVADLEIAEAYSPEEKLALAAVEQAVLDIGAKRTHSDRGAEDRIFFGRNEPDSTEAWLDGRMTVYCKAARLEIDWLIRMLKGVGLL